MNKENFSNIETDALKNEVHSLKMELFTLRLNASAMHVKDYSQFKKLKKRIAQALTELNKRDRI